MLLSMRSVPCFRDLFLSPLVYAMACWLLGYVLAPTQFVKVVHQETGMPYLRIVVQHVAARNFKIFFSGVHVYALRQFISSFAFGIGLWMYNLSLVYLEVSHSVVLFIWKAVLAGFAETAITLFLEKREIAANKGDLVRSEPSIWDIAFPIFLRNFICAMAPISSHIILTCATFSTLINALVCLLVSIAFSLLSMPFDLVATINCGSGEYMTCFGRLKHIIWDDKQFASIFSGSLVRVIQNTVYSIAVSLLMCIL